MPILALEGSAGQAEVQFVDGMTADAGVRLDLMETPFSTQAGSDFSPPQLRRAMSSNMLADGGHLSASAFEVRTIRLELLLSSSFDVDFSFYVRALYEELLRPRNILRLRLGPNPVYFRTWAAPEAAMALLAGIQETTHTVEILAEPFAYGERVDLGSHSTDLAGGFVTSVDGADVLGDLPAPTVVTFDVAPDKDLTLHLSSRTGVLPLATVADVDDDTWLPDTTHVIETDAYAFGGSFRSMVLAAAGDFTFREFPGIALRAGQTDRTALPGLYRAWLLIPGVAVQDPANRWRLELGLGFQGYYEGGGYPSINTVTVSNLPALVDMGLIQAPFAQAQTSVGFGPEMEMADMPLTLRVTRDHVAGTSEFAVDALILTPADETTLLLSGITPSTQARSFTVDPHSGHLTAQDNTGKQVPDQVRAQYLGATPILTPGQDCSLVAFQSNRGVYTDAYVAPTVFSLAYWPRYLTVA